MLLFIWSLTVCGCIWGSLVKELLWEWEEERFFAVFIQRGKNWGGRPDFPESDGSYPGFMVILHNDTITGCFTVWGSVLFIEDVILETCSLHTVLCLWDKVL